MKTIFEIKPYRGQTAFTLSIYEMIAAHNSGDTLIRLVVIEQHALMVKALHLANVDMERNGNILMISENNKLVMTIIEKEVMELNEAQRDLLTSNYSR